MDVVLRNEAVRVPVGVHFSLYALLLLPNIHELILFLEEQMISHWRLRHTLRFQSIRFGHLNCNFSPQIKLFFSFFATVPLDQSRG